MLKGLQQDMSYHSSLNYEDPNPKLKICVMLEMYSNWNGILEVLLPALCGVCLTRMSEAHITVDATRISGNWV